MWGWGTGHSCSVAGKSKTLTAMTAPSLVRLVLSLSEQKVSTTLWPNADSGLRQSWSEMKFFLHQANRVTKVSTLAWRNGMLSGYLNLLSVLAYWKLLFQMGQSLSP